MGVYKPHSVGRQPNRNRFIAGRAAGNRLWNDASGYRTRLRAAALVAVPLNIAYGILAFLTWCVPLVYKCSIPAAYVGIAAFLLKRVGTIVMPTPLVSLETMGLDPAWSIPIVLVVLVTLAAAHFLCARRVDDIPTAHNENSVNDLYEEAVAQIERRHHLTPRERDVTLLLGKGGTTKSISSTLSTAEATVRTHIMHIYRKLGINSQQELVELVEKEMHGSE